MNKIIRTGVIGLGEVAQLMHLPILRKNADCFSIDWICDVSPSLCRHVQQLCGGGPKIARDCEELCAASDLDLVMVLSPDHYHLSHARCAIEAGKHVFIEKPVCLTKGQLESLRAVSRERPECTVMVGYMRRYARTFELAKQALAELPACDHVQVQDIICEGPFFIRQSSPVFRPTDLDPAILGEGRCLFEGCLRESCAGRESPERMRAWQVLTGLSSHSLSAMRELLGSPKSVVSATVKKGGEAMSIVFDYGDFCAVYQVLIDNIARFDARIEIFSDRRKIKLNYDCPYIRNLPTTLEIEESGYDDTQCSRIGPFYKDAFEIELENLYSHLAAGTKPKTGLDDSLEDFELFEKIMEQIP